MTPFLPGDSLLFATGALAALGTLNLPALLACYVVAATLGDAVNYASEGGKGGGKGLAASGVSFAGASKNCPCVAGPCCLPPP